MYGARLCLKTCPYLKMENMERIRLENPFGWKDIEGLSGQTVTKNGKQPLKRTLLTEKLLCGEIKASNHTVETTRRNIYKSFQLGDGKSP